MTKVLLITQDKGGVGKSLATRGLAEVVPGAPVIEVDASPRLLELGKRAKFFKTRADREDIESTGGAASRSEFDPVIDAIASATLPSIVDIGANTCVSLLTVIADLAEDFAAAGNDRLRKRQDLASEARRTQCGSRCACRSHQGS